MPDDASNTIPLRHSRQQRLHEFVDWTRQHITGDEKGQAQIFLDRLFQAFGSAEFLTLVISVRSLRGVDD
ncbi:MAG TPA: hypothetical protein VKX17_06415 [Planctomycetota bacterium]|nr:hypothetical protein [Planctomycetota bacterium]